MDELKSLMQKRQAAKDKGKLDVPVMKQAAHVIETFVLKLFSLAVKKNPKEKKIEEYRNFAKIMSADNLGVITNLIKDEFYKYQNEIIKKDDKFFLELKIESNTEVVNYFTDILRKTYTLLSAEEKEITWTYVGNISFAVAIYKICDKNDPIYHI